MDLISYSRMYIKVVEHQGFSKAAKLFDLNPSSVSRQMTQLEEALGVRLLNRSTRNLGVTVAGRHYYEHVKKIITDFDSLNVELSNMQSTAKGVLSVSMPVAIGEHKIAYWMPEFLQRYPDIHLNISFSDSLSNLIEDDLDLVIRLSDPKDSSLISLRLSDIHFGLYASPGYIEQHGMPSKPEDLTQHNCLVYSDGKAQTEWQCIKGRSKKLVPVSGNFSTKNASALINATKQGLGVCLISAWSVESCVKDKSLVQVLPDYKVSLKNMAKSAVYILYPHRTHLDKKARVFIDFMKEKTTFKGG